jgi:hypothetical protein
MAGEEVEQGCDPQQVVNLGSGAEVTVASIRIALTILAAAGSESEIRRFVALAKTADASSGDEKKKKEIRDAAILAWQYVVRGKKLRGFAAEREIAGVERRHGLG